MRGGSPERCIEGCGSTGVRTGERPPRCERDVRREWESIFVGTNKVAFSGYKMQSELMVRQQYDAGAASQKPEISNCHWPREGRSPGGWEGNSGNATKQFISKFEMSG